ncbi:PAS domain-containing protein [Streptomyces sp. NPDC050560]|uniref:PAS domain-containing protein n=1 Tax=Streptomyces sp. NPDC050560 TaxID=3365630 RepID=UPI0037AF6B1B
MRDTDVPFSDSRIRGDDYGDVLLSLFECSDIGLATLDPALRVRSVNSAFRDQCGRRHDDICERDFAEFLHPSVRQYVLRQFDRLLDGHETRLASRSVAMWFHDSTVFGQLTAVPVEGDNGEIEMVLVQFTPGQAAEGHQGLVGPQWKLAPITAKVLEGVAAGDPTVRLAAKLFLSRQGVEYHVSYLLRSFKVPNRTALAAKAYSMGMFSIGSWPPRVLPDYIRPDCQPAGRARDEAAAEARAEWQS